MDINMTLLGQTIAMLVFVWFCMKFIWPPIMTAIEERQTEIADGLAAAERGQNKLEQAKAEADEIIGDARKQATTILDQAHARANEIIAEGKTEGIRERERQLAAARSEVEQETNRAREELRGQVSAIAVASAEKILRREI
ncbi:MAG: F0F1 ATP synthase subunit B, partial [Woeseia sp.]